jgi:hypothetical protein
LTSIAKQTETIKSGKLQESHLVYIEDLRHKITLARGAFRIVSDADFAAELGVSAQALADYLSDRGKGRDDVPPARLDAFAELLVRRLPGRLTLDQARLAWCADLKSFQTAIAPSPASALSNLLDRTRSTVEVTLHPRGSGRSLGMLDDEDALDVTIERLPADLRFELGFRGGRSGALVVALAESVIGWHIAVPRRAQIVTIGAERFVRAPQTGLRFSREGGLYVFHAFLIDSAQAPSLLARSDKVTPLGPDDLNAFAVELADPVRTKAFWTGRLSVFVEPAA